MAEGNDPQAKPDLSGSSEQGIEASASKQDVLAEVEAFLDKIALVSGGDKGTEVVAGASGGAEGGSESMADMLGGLRVSKAEEGAVSDSAQDWQYRFPDSAPSCSDFVPKEGKDLEEQEREHNRKKKQQLHVGGDDDDDSDDDPGDADEEFAKKETDEDLALDNPLLRVQMNCPTLTQLIFGEEANQTETQEEEFTTDKLKELLELILPKDGEVREEDGIQMPKDGRPLLLDAGHSLGPDKLKTMYEMMGLYDEEGRKRKGLFDKT